MANQNFKENIEKNYYLAQSLAGTGHLELWEWEKVKKSISLPSVEEISIDTALSINEANKKIIDWSSNTIRTAYANELNIFSQFEPLAHSFLDNKIRSTMLLFYGNEVSKLNDFVTDKMVKKIMYLIYQIKIRLKD